MNFDFLALLFSQSTSWSTKSLNTNGKFLPAIKDSSRPNLKIKPQAKLLAIPFPVQCKAGGPEVSVDSVGA